MVARVKSGVLDFFGLRDSNLLVSLEMSVMVLMSSQLSSAASGVSISWSMMDFSSPCLSGGWG